MQRFRRWLAKIDPTLGDRMTADVQAKVEKLKMPQDIGRPGRFAGTRELSITRWHKVVIYRLNEDRVEIVTVLDTRMDPPDAL